jgi:glycosyltransferase involved in cell wall biosynthesis
MDALVSVILITFDREDALAAVLTGLARQHDRNFEVIVADDGSGSGTAELIQAWKGRLDAPLAHVWQEHRGFRAAEIRNRAILASSGSYCVFLDGDCIPRPDFLAQHRRLAEPGWFVFGNRVLLSRPLTEAVLRGEDDPAGWALGGSIGKYLTGGINRVLPLMTAPLGPMRKISPRCWQDVRSCNLAVWRADLDRVDGFDARFRGWGLEDSDLAIRLIRSGCRRKNGRFATGVLHLWHDLQDRASLGENELRLEETVAGARIRAVEGLSSLMGTKAGG